MPAKRTFLFPPRHGAFWPNQNSLGGADAVTFAEAGYRFSEIIESRAVIDRPYRYNSTNSPESEEL
jgi:hypothetical protein